MYERFGATTKAITEPIAETGELIQISPAVIGSSVKCFDTEHLDLCFHRLRVITKRSLFVTDKASFITMVQGERTTMGIGETQRICQSKFVGSSVCDARWFGTPSDEPLRLGGGFHLINSARHGDSSYRASRLDCRSGHGMPGLEPKSATEGKRQLVRTLQEQHG